MAFEFIKQELTEARLLRNERNLPTSIDDLVHSLFLHVLTLEILRHEDPKFASNYAKNTLQYQFDKIRNSATDLHNQVAVINNKDMYHDKIAVPSEHNVPMLQFKTYLRGIQNGRYDNGAVRQLLYRMQKFLNVTDQKLIAARRAVADWPGLTDEEKKGALALLERHYKLHSRRSDLYPKLPKGAKGKAGMGLAKKAAIAFGAGYALGRAFK